ncbi:MAG: aspartate aminotransferase family protein [Armatimonadetes bacterium]|nr:aspartate aminotransferase family protein [Armatimonadota bacterium]
MSDLAAILTKYKLYLNPGLAKLLDFMGFGVVEHRAEGCYVWDEDGNQYLDFLGGFGVYSLGHNPPEVRAAVHAQLDLMPMSSRLMMSRQQADLAELLAEITPGELRHTFFCNSGAEAVEGAIKLVRMFFHAQGKPRTRIVSTWEAFHGKTLGGLSVSGRAKYRAPFEPLIPGVVHVPYGDAEALAAAVDDNTAAVILEPVQGEAGAITPPDGYLRAAREACDRHGAKLIFDEVQTGFGRTGYLFGCEHDGVAPDVMTLAKALGGGVMPIGAVITTPEVWQPMIANPLIHTSTWGGNPLACAAGLAAVRSIIAQDLASKARERGNQLLAGLRELQGQFPEMVKSVRGRGLLVGVEFFDEDIGGLCIAKLALKKLLIAYALNKPETVRLEPPLVVTAEQIDLVLGYLREALGETAELVAALKSAG